jgi:hypothetical protein
VYPLLSIFKARLDPITPRPMRPISALILFIVYNNNIVNRKPKNEAKFKLKIF